MCPRIYIYNVSQILYPAFILTIYVSKSILTFCLRIYVYKVFQNLKFVPEMPLFTICPRTYISNKFQKLGFLNFRSISFAKILSPNENVNKNENFRSFSRKFSFSFFSRNLRNLFEIWTFRKILIFLQKYNLPDTKWKISIFTERKLNETFAKIFHFQGGKKFRRKFKRK